MRTDIALPAATVPFGDIPLRRVLERAGYALFTLLVFLTPVQIVRPSPYDLVAVLTIGLWGIVGLRFHRAAIAFVALLLIHNMSLVASLLGHADDGESIVWTFQSLYLMLTAFFFCLFLGEKTERRVDLALDAYVASCAVAAVLGIYTYFQGPFYPSEYAGRAMGPFADPNVFGAFMVLGVFRLAHQLFTGRTRRSLVTAALLGLVVAGLFLSFSRGAWLATALGGSLMTFFILATYDERVRRRIVGLVVIGMTGTGILVAGLLSSDLVADRFSDRVHLTKEYDEGEMGRFGNQRRSIPMLLDHPEGLGPLRFRNYFGFEPHNSYLGGLANGGWIGGISFLALALTTIFVGLRLCWLPSPVRRHAQVVAPAMLMTFLQALQIDIDHWRHIYLQLGLVWGLECGRVHWASLGNRWSSFRERGGPAA